MIGFYKRNFAFPRKRPIKAKSWFSWFYLSLSQNNYKAICKSRKEKETFSFESTYSYVHKSPSVVRRFFHSSAYFTMQCLYLKTSSPIPLETQWRRGTFCSGKWGLKFCSPLMSPVRRQWVEITSGRRRNCGSLYNFSPHTLAVCRWLWIAHQNTALRTLLSHFSWQFRRKTGKRRPDNVFNLFYFTPFLIKYL